MGLGATKSAILMQFLVEAIAISTLGGLIGAGSGITIAFNEIDDICHGKTMTFLGWKKSAKSDTVFL
jgi:ABC-type antimicrobial peptide transport system permease subunit